LLVQRETARAYTASALGDGQADDGESPDGDGDRQRGRWRPFWRRAALPAQEVNGQPAAAVPADAPVPAE
jgi:hypothetical protein